MDLVSLSHLVMPFQESQKTRNSRDIEQGLLSVNSTLYIRKSPLQVKMPPSNFGITKLENASKHYVNIQAW
jgi:hypothetical protein